jgi:hypothetical protein
MGTSIPNLVQNGVLRAVPFDDELLKIFSSDLSCTYLLFIALAFRAGSRFAGGTMCRMTASIVLLICFPPLLGVLHTDMIRRFSLPSILNAWTFT